MALIMCPECGKEVSDRASSCIHCGFPLDERRLVNTTHLVNNPSQSTQQAVSAGFALFSADMEHVNIECKKCRKIYKYNRARYFDSVTKEYCIPNTLIQCPNCLNTVIAHSQIRTNKTKSLEQSSHSTNQTSTSTQQSGGKGCLVIFIILALLGLLTMCGKSGHDGKCDVAGCGRSATCSFGDMEMCTSHYAEWSDKAYKYNHRND